MPTGVTTSQLDARLQEKKESVGTHLSANPERSEVAEQ
jgi:hypothetical protein